MKSKYIKIGCMSDKPLDEFAKCYRVTTKILIKDKYVNVYDSYRAMASSYEVSKYRQIYTGMSPDERQCITCDVDIPFDEKVIEEIKYKCSLYHLPLPTHVVVNLKNILHRPSTDQRHYQIQWELDKPFYAKDWAQKDRRSCEPKDTYLSILERLADIFNGDRNYKGLWHKNAYCPKEIQRIAISDNTASLSAFLKWDTSSKKMYKPSKEAPCKEATPIKSPALSRNCYMLSKLPSKIYYYAYNNNRFPSTRLVMKWAKDLERESLKINKKHDIEPDYLIRATVNGVLNKCKQSYNAANIEKSNTRRDLSLALRRVKRGFNVIKVRELLEKKVLKKEIARLLDININSVTAYSKVTLEDVKKDFLYFLDFYTRNDIKGYEDTYRAVTDTLSCLY